jgi:hypothetical protein
MVHDVQCVIPRLRTLRRVSQQYRHCLPLKVMQRHQCIVVGGEQGSLTVAMADCRQTYILTYLRWLTGCAIFPVQVDPARVRLLIKRVEWSMSVRRDLLRQASLYHPLRIRSMLTFCHIYHASLARGR